MSALESAFWVFLCGCILCYTCFEVGVATERAHGIAVECVKPGTTIRAPRVGVTS